MQEAQTQYPIHELIRRRWSPYVFSAKMIPRDDILSVFEAARWAPSAYNEQPWRFVVAAQDRPDEYERILSCLEEGNQRWARSAPVLALGVVKTTFTLNGKTNRVALHDLGQSLATLTLEATNRGIQVHQMGGILPDRAKRELAIPDGYEVVVAFALGYPETVDSGPAELRDRESKPRQRRPLSELVFGASWGTPVLD